MRKFIVIALLAALPLMQGCAVFVASQLGYYEAKSKYSRLYSVYESLQEEEGAPVQDYEEWLKEQPLTHNEVKVFVIRGILSKEEAQQIRAREGGY
ncbi:MAG: hypothetical protein V1925_04890 [Candidatus Omnitrophota bacterium]